MHSQNSFTTQFRPGPVPQMYSYATAFLGHGHAGRTQQSMGQRQRMASNYRPTMVSVGAQAQVNHPYHYHPYQNACQHVHHGSHRRHYHHPWCQYYLPHHQQPPQMGMVYVANCGTICHLVPTYPMPVFVPNMNYLAAGNFYNGRSRSTDMRSSSTISSSEVNVSREPSQQPESSHNLQPSSSSTASHVQDGSRTAPRFIIPRNTSFQDAGGLGLATWTPNKDFFDDILSNEFDPDETLLANGLTRVTSRYLPMIFEKNYSSSSPDSGSSSGLASSTFLDNNSTHE